MENDAIYKDVLSTESEVGDANEKLAKLWNEL